MWTVQDMQYFQKADWGDKLLKDECGCQGWWVEMIHSTLKEEMTAEEFVKKVHDDAVSGEFSVSDICEKYLI